MVCVCSLANLGRHHAPPQRLALLQTRQVKLDQELEAANEIWVQSVNEERQLRARRHGEHHNALNQEERKKERKRENLEKTARSLSEMTWKRSA